VALAVLTTEQRPPPPLRPLAVAAPARLVNPRPRALTPAELEVLRLLPTHESFAQIGQQLRLSRRTVKAHTISGYRKLDVASRSDAIARAQAFNLIPTQRPANENEQLR
jgi:ATP/maltotriose-dependent transcriptional regulator MalT